jgi:hypothetical protein
MMVKGSEEEMKRALPILELFDEKTVAFLGGILNSKAAKILYLLYSLHPNTVSLRYSEIADYTKLGSGNQLYYPLQNLQHLGLIRKIKVNEHVNGYSLTGAGLISAELLHTLVKDIVENADLLPPETRNRIASINAAISEVEKSIKASKLPTTLEYLRKRY